MAVNTAMFGNPRMFGGLVALSTFALDQIVKRVFLVNFGFAAMAPGEAIRVTPFFNLVMVWNKGVSFGLFPADSAAGRIFLLTFSGLVVVALLLWLWRTDQRLSALGIGLVVGGALGNMLDRLRYGAVADFFHLHAFGYDWYVFNVADAAIVAGVGLLLYESLWGPKRSSPSQGPSKQG